VPNPTVGSVEFALTNEFYKDAGPRSNCPQFVNSGQYIGDALSLEKKYNFTLSMDVGSRPGRLQRSDQFRLAYYWSLHRDTATLDYASSLFRNFMFGLVDASKPGGRTCGSDAIPDINGCGQRTGARIAATNTSTGIIEMDEVPGNCPWESASFNIHTAGGAKGYLTNLAKGVDQCSINHDSVL